MPRRIVTKAVIRVAERTPGLIAETRLHLGDQSLCGWGVDDLNRTVRDEFKGAWVRCWQEAQKK